MTSAMSQFHTVHPIMPESFKQVKMLDKYSDNYVYIMLEDMDEEACESMAYAYGIFNNDTLIGYCTLGSGIGVLDDIRQASETVVLSDVYILDSYRNCGLGSKLVKEAIEQKLKNDPTIKNVFLTILDIDLKDFYEKLGFKSLPDDDYSMLYVPC